MEQLSAAVLLPHGSRVPFALPDDLPAAAALLERPGRVTILTGFACVPGLASETDGPPGAMALARALAHRGCRVVLATDDLSRGVVQAALDAAGALAPGHVEVQSFPGAACWTDAAEARLGALAAQTDLLVAIERPSAADDGAYYTMRARELPQTDVAPLERLLKKDTPSIGIGDGGNEVGMARVRERLLRETDLSPQILATSATDRLVVATVSNWGAYALLGALALRCCDASVLPSQEEEEAVVHAIVAAGAPDGVTGVVEATVDGLPLQASMDALARVRAVVLGALEASPSPSPGSGSGRSPRSSLLLLLGAGVGCALAFR